MASAVHRRAFFGTAFMDSCAFDHDDGSAEAVAVAELFRLNEKRRISLILAHSTRRETDHPHTPSSVQQQASAMIYSVNVQLSPPERILLRRIEALLRGNAKPGKHAQDARHVFESQKYGGTFITVDGRLLDKAPDLWKLCRVAVMTPSEYLAKIKLAIQERLDGV